MKEQALTREGVSFQGRLLEIFIAGERAALPRAVAEIEAVPGGGLRGDRYFQEGGAAASGDREVTLIEMEALDALERECQIRLEPVQARRNLVTRGVPLNHLIGREFRVGEVVLRGMRLCEPCKHLEAMTQTGVLKGLVHRGGLRAHIVQGGTLRPGDVILPQEEAVPRPVRPLEAAHPSRG